jgi:hypothetical protein
MANVLANESELGPKDLFERTVAEFQRTLRLWKDQRNEHRGVIGAASA